MKNLSVPEQHRVKIAIKTLRMADTGQVTGLNARDEAMKFLKSLGYTHAEIMKMSESTISKRRMEIAVELSLNQEIRKAIALLETPHLK